jgi:hypothetical protein
MRHLPAHRVPARRLRPRVLAPVAIAAAATVGLLASGPALADESFLGGLHHITLVKSTVPQTPNPRPGNGDVNPYGVVVVPQSIGDLVKGDILVSNFNNSNNLQGTGRTIVEISPSGTRHAFTRLPGLMQAPGLTTALGVLPGGFVIVGSLPTTDGSSATATAGALLILDSHGRLVERIHGGDINGPWDLTTVSAGPWSEVFVSNVLNGTVAANGGVVNKGTVVRLVINSAGPMPKVVANQVIASGFPERTDPAALVVGPTGLGLGRDGTLYVADTAANQIRAIPDAVFRFSDAGTGSLVAPQQGNGTALNGPLGLTIAPGGDILTVNGGDGKIVETTPDGEQVASKLIDNSVSGPGAPPGQGALFGLAITPDQHGVYFVDDATNQLDLLSP